MRTIIISAVIIAVATAAVIWSLRTPTTPSSEQSHTPSAQPQNTLSRTDMVVVVTEDNAPLSYLEGTAVRGQATQLVQEVLTGADLPFTITLYPWARAYNIANNTPNALIYSIARTPEREELFKWVGAIAPRRYVLYKLNSRTDISVTSLKEASNYTIGVVKDDVRAKYLISENVPVEEVSDDAQNLHKLQGGRIDLFPISPTKLAELCETEKVDCTRFAPVYELDFRPDLYMAFSRATPDEIVDRARASYAALVADGALTRILPTYWQE